MTEDQLKTFKLFKLLEPLKRSESFEPRLFYCFDRLNILNLLNYSSGLRPQSKPFKSLELFKPFKRFELFELLERLEPFEH